MMTENTMSSFVHLRAPAKILSEALWLNKPKSHTGAKNTARIACVFSLQQLGGKKLPDAVKHSRE